MRRARSVGIGSLGGVEEDAALDRVLSAARDLISEVKSHYRWGGAKIGLSPDKLASWLTMGGWGAFAWATGTGQQSAIEHNYAELGRLIGIWADERFGWAKAGRRDDGSDYSWEKWADEGRFYAKEIPLRVQQVWDYSAVLLFADAVTQTARDYAEVLARIGAVIRDPSVAMPAWLKVAIGAAVLLVAWSAYRDVSPAFKAAGRTGSEVIEAAGTRAKHALSGRRGRRRVRGRRPEARRR